MTSSNVVEKQLSEELAVFRSMGAKCVEKDASEQQCSDEYSSGATCNTASALHQPVTSRADEENRPGEQHVKMEQESFQTKHVSGLESNATTPQSVQLELCSGL